MLVVCLSIWDSIGQGSHDKAKGLRCILTYRLDHNDEDSSSYVTYPVSLIHKNKNRLFNKTELR